METLPRIGIDQIGQRFDRNPLLNRAANVFVQKLCKLDKQRLGGALAHLNVDIPTYAWYGDLTLRLGFPEEWEVAEHRMAGHDAPAMTKDQIRIKLIQPIGSKPLSEIAKGKKECVILVDDLTRPTKASQVIPQILDELQRAGMRNHHIRFVMATGAREGLRGAAPLKKTPAPPHETNL